MEMLPTYLRTFHLQNSDLFIFCQHYPIIWNLLTSSMRWTESIIQSSKFKAVFLLLFFNRSVIYSHKNIHIIRIQHRGVIAVDHTDHIFGKTKKERERKRVFPVSQKLYLASKSLPPSYSLKCAPFFQQ